MSVVSFADVVHHSIAWSHAVKSQELLLQLVDTRWVQRLRDISQTGNARLVYMFSEHSRFGHSVGVAALAELLLEKLEREYPEQVRPWRCAVSAAALLHDIGHLAPGSHTAFKTWFPDQPDIHETIAIEIVKKDPQLRATLERFGPELVPQVCAILAEDDAIPPWTWEIISGGGWNVDRGNWCIVDSVMAGVTYGKYNIPALTDSISITNDGHVALRENRIDAMLHFALSRHAMYRQVYQHRVLLSADTLNRAIVQRARDARETVPFSDAVMDRVLAARTPAELDIETCFRMTESWWRYHITTWRDSEDTVLADLCSRLLERRLFKTVRIGETEAPGAFKSEAEEAVRRAGFDPRYYLHEISTYEVHAGDSKQALGVVMDDGRRRPLHESEPLFAALFNSGVKRNWIAVPAEAKLLMGRER